MVGRGRRHTTTWSVASLDFSLFLFIRCHSACDFPNPKLLQTSAHSLYLFDVWGISWRSAECDLKYFVGVYFGGGGVQSRSLSDDVGGLLYISVQVDQEGVALLFSFIPLLFRLALALPPFFIEKKKKAGPHTHTHPSPSSLHPQ